MGSLSGGIFAQNHIPVKFFARTLEKAEAERKQPYHNLEVKLLEIISNVSVTMT